MAANTQTFLIQEGVLSEGTVTNPQLIGTNNTEPNSFFTVTQIGYFKQGSITINLPKEFATFRSGTPAIKLRKDLTFKEFQISGELGQFDGANIALLKNLNAQLSYSVTIPSVQTHDLLHMGSDEPVATPSALVLASHLTNGDEFNIYIYSGLFKQEDDSISLSGTEHAVQPFTIDAFVHAGFDGVTDEAQKHYGLIDIRTA